MLAQAANAVGLGSQYTTGPEPVWSKEVFKELVLARSLEGGVTQLPPPPKLTLDALHEALALLKVQLRTLFESEAAGSLNQPVGRVHKAFEDAVEMSRLFSQIKDHAGFFELLTTVVSRVKALTPGSSLVIPGGFKGGLLLYVLHCDSFDESTLAICSAAEGLEFHPARIDPATGGAQFNSPLLIPHIPSQRVRDGAVWFMLLRAAVMPDAKHSATLLYSQIFPFLNSRPLLANLPSSEAAAPTPGAATSAAAALGSAGIPARWWTPRASGDPYGYDLCSLAAVVALQLSQASENRPLGGGMGGGGMGGGVMGGGAGGAVGMPSGAPGWASAPTYSADGLELLLKQQLITMATKDLT